MSSNRLLTLAVPAWAVIVVVSLGVRSALIAAPITLTEGLGWLFLAGAPAGAFALMVRNAAAPSIAKVLYDTEHPASRDATTATKGSRAEGR